MSFMIGRLMFQPAFIVCDSMLSFHFTELQKFFVPWHDKWLENCVFLPDVLFMVEKPAREDNCK